MLNGSEQCVFVRQTKVVVLQVVKESFEYRREIVVLMDGREEIGERLDGEDAHADVGRFQAFLKVDGEECSHVLGEPDLFREKLNGK